MVEHERKGANRATRTSDETPQTTAKASVAGKAQKLKKNIDDVLAEIDDVLEKNAEEFVKSYVQRGGE